MTATDPAASPPVAAVPVPGRPRGHGAGNVPGAETRLSAPGTTSPAPVAALGEVAAAGAGSTRARKPRLAGLALIAARMPENGGSESLDGTQACLPGFASPSEMPTAALDRWPQVPPSEDIYAHLTLDLEPVSKNRARISPAEYTQVGAARIKTKKAHGYSSPRLKEYEGQVGWLLRQAKVKRNDVDDLGVHAIFYVRGNQRRDLDNLVKSLLDGCNKVAWRDDAQVTKLTSEVVRSSDHPRVELVIYVARSRAQGCAKCGRPLTNTKITLKAIYCSKECYDSEQQRGAYKECVVCGTYVYRDAEKTAAAETFCSPACRASGRGLCRNCGQPNEHPWSTGKYCSAECSEEWHRKKPLASKAVPGVCEDCGGTTSSARAKRCRGCFIRKVSIQGQVPRRLSAYDSCPQCGARKRTISAVCATCNKTAVHLKKAGRWKTGGAA